METKQFLLDVFARIESEFDQVLARLPPGDLNHQPGPESNSIGWLLWHTARSQDRMNADLFGEDQLWVSQKWHLKFNRAPDQKDTGVGHTTEQAAAFRAPDAKTLQDYYHAVAARSRDYINTRLTPQDLERVVWSPTLGSSSTVEGRIIGVVYNLQHIGQAGYVRGMLHGKGWYGR